MVDPTPQWVQILSVGTNISILIVGIKIVRHLSRMELKVDTMWSAFIRKFGARGSNEDE